MVWIAWSCPVKVYCVVIGPCCQSNSTLSVSGPARMEIWSTRSSYISATRRDPGRQMHYIAEDRVLSPPQCLKMVVWPFLSNRNGNQRTTSTENTDLKDLLVPEMIDPLLYILLGRNMVPFKEQIIRSWVSSGSHVRRRTTPIKLEAVLPALLGVSLQLLVQE